MMAELTPRCIKAILRGENIEKPVVKFLRYDRDQYCRIEPRDGALKKMILVSELTILVKGEVVGDITATSENYERLDGVVEIPNTSMEISTSEQIPADDSVTMEPKLTPGCIKAMMRGENIENPVVQLLKYHRVEVEYTTRGGYQLVISDGTCVCSFVWLAFQLIDLIINGELQIDSIIRLDEVACIEPYGKKMKYLLIRKLTILVNGNVEEVITNTSINSEEIDGVQSISDTSKEVVDTAAKLTPGCIEAILSGENVEHPVVQFLSYNQSVLKRTKQEFYDVTLYDGTRIFPFIILVPRLNYLISSGELQENSIIRLDQYRYVEPPHGPFKKIIVIKGLTILVKGEIRTATSGNNERIDSAQQISNKSMIVSTSNRIHTYVARFWIASLLLMLLLLFQLCLQ